MSRLVIPSVVLSLCAMVALVAGAPMVVPPLLALIAAALGAVGHRRTLERQELELARRERLGELARTNIERDVRQRTPPQGRR